MQLDGPITSAATRHASTVKPAEGETEDHPQRQPRLLVAERPRGPRASNAIDRVLGAGLPAEADVPAGEAEGRTGERTRVPRDRAASPRREKPDARDRGRLSSLLLAELQQHGAA